MECNRDEAIRAKEMAEKKMEVGDFVGAQMLVMKAERLFPNLDNITQLKAVCDVHCSAQNKINCLENWYGILQVEQSTDEITIRKQYRKLALLLHPDKNKFSGAEAAFKLIGEANRLLTDQTTRSLYDIKCRATSRGFGSKSVPPQSNMNAGKQYGTGKNIPNFVPNQKVSYMAFWTCCQFCGMRYKYLREYVNRILRCQNCHKSFTAYEVGFDVVPPGSNPGRFFSRKEVPSQGPSRVPAQSSYAKPYGVQHADKSTDLSQSSKPEVGKTVTGEEKHSEKDVSGGKDDVEMPKRVAAKSQSEVNEPVPNAAKSQSEANEPVPSAAKLQSEANEREPSAAKSQFEVNETKASAAKSQSEVAKPTVPKSESPVTKHKPDAAKIDEKATSKSRESKKKRKVVEESSESFVDGTITGQNSEENQKRRSSRKKRQISYAENGSDDDFVSPPPKKSKASRTSNSDGEMKETGSAGGLSENMKFDGSAACVDTCKKEIKEKANFTFEESSLNKENGGEGCKTNREGVISGPIEETSNIPSVSKSNENVMLEPELFTIPDPEFSDFDKDKTVGSFAVTQVWAIYDPADGMPRFYARVRKVFSSGFKLKITWLEPQLDNQQEQNETDEHDMPIACGKFKIGETEVTEDGLIFSHQMHHSICNRWTFIYPKKGETWALFRDWDISWSTDPEKRKPPYRYDFVEILTDFSENLGIGVGYLGKVKGFVSLFERAEQYGVIAFHIPPGEIYRFSHKVPSFRMTGKEKEGVPANSFELDPAALPNNIFDLGHASDVKLANGSSPKAPETEAESMEGSGRIHTPKKRHKTNNSKGEASNAICKNLDQDHTNQSLNEEDKGVTSKGNSTSQDHGMNSSKKPENGNRTMETLKLRRSPRCLSEQDGREIASWPTAQYTDKPNNYEHHDVPTQSDDKMNTLKKLEKEDCVTESSRLRRTLRGFNKTDGQPNGSQCATENTNKQSNPNKYGNNHDFSSQSNGSRGVMKSSKPVTLVSSSCRPGGESPFDFKEGKSEEKFQVHQIWALYSSKDGMPKEYAQIKKIETTPIFRLHVVLLESYSSPKCTTHPVCCGLFKVKNAKSKLLPRSSFSHQPQAVQVDKNKYRVYPRKGEIWALYKNDNSGQCDIVEVLEDDGQVIKLVSLKCVNRSKSLYRVTRSQRSMTGMVDVPRTEITRFSHQIPAFRHSSEKDRLRGCWELDRSAIPGLTIILD